MTSLMPAHADAVTRLGSLLADTTRTRILLELRRGHAYPSELADRIGVSRQVMSNQLSCLRGCGMVEAVPDGRRSIYRLTDPQVGTALEDLMRLVLVIEPDCCGPDGCACA